MRAFASLAVLGALLVAFAACPTPVGSGPDDAGVADSGFTTCDSDSQCGAGRCVNGVCSDVQCSVKADCAAGKVCEQGQCTAPPASCTTSVDCPGNQICDGFAHTCSGGEGEGEGSSAGEGEGEGSSGASIDLSGYTVVDQDSGASFTFPHGTSLFAGHSLVLGRNDTKAQFESAWGTLPSTAFYLEGNGFPVVNGGEKLALEDASGGTVDGPTFAGQTGKDYQRTSAGSASSSSSWSTSSDTAASATPGATSLSSGAGLKITEWSDAPSFSDEFVEVSYLP